MNTEVLDELRVDNCEICGAVDWRDCVCDPDLPRKQPTPQEIERARQERLTRREQS